MPSWLTFFLEAQADRNSTAQANECKQDSFYFYRYFCDMCYWMVVSSSQSLTYSSFRIMTPAITYANYIGIHLDFPKAKSNTSSYLKFQSITFMYIDHYKTTTAELYIKSPPW